MKNSQSNSGLSGQNFSQLLVDQTPYFDKRRKHNKQPKKHRGNLPRPVNFLK
jgi:hypothetical protein